jgi:hypothetical protein
MLAIPERGYVFTNWMPVTVFAYSFTYTNESGVQVVVSTNIVDPQPEYIRRPVLEFTMQPAEIIVDNSVLKIIASEGWQANFVPVRNRHGFTSRF